MDRKTGRQMNRHTDRRLDGQLAGQSDINGDIKQYKRRAIWCGYLLPPPSPFHCGTQLITSGTIFPMIPMDLNPSYWIYACQRYSECRTQLQKSPQSTFASAISWPHNKDDLENSFASYSTFFDPVCEINKHVKLVVVNGMRENREWEETRNVRTHVCLCWWVGGGRKRVLNLL